MDEFILFELSGEQWADLREAGWLGEAVVGPGHWVHERLPVHVDRPSFRRP